jgi:hypothetical protein
MVEPQRYKVVTYCRTTRYFGKGVPDDIGDPGLPIEVLAFGATERGTENGGMLVPLRIRRVVARNGNVTRHSARIG